MELKELYKNNGYFGLSGQNWRKVADFIFDNQDNFPYQTVMIDKIVLRDWMNAPTVPAEFAETVFVKDGKGRNATVKMVKFLGEAI